MKRFHLIFGSGAFLLFLITGYLMRSGFPDKDTVEGSLRMLMRSRHIYLLMSALINILLGVYYRPFGTRTSHHLQSAGSSLVTAGSVILAAAFFFETYSYGRHTFISAFGIIATAGGVGLHLLASAYSE